MDAAVIGKKIKEARISQKLTQSEVVGSFITRNMLSQIESGAALPSMKTLAYLASALNIPLSSLLEDDLQNTPEKEFKHTTVSETLSYMKQLLQEKRYKELLTFSPEESEYLSASDPLFDERAALAAKASYECALLAEAAGRLGEAITHAKNAEHLSSLGIYANPALKTESVLLLAKLAEALRATIP